jgi:hypothetical protein
MSAGKLRVIPAPKPVAGIKAGEKVTITCTVTATEIESS